MRGNSTDVAHAVGTTALRSAIPFWRELHQIDCPEKCRLLNKPVVKLRGNVPGPQLGRNRCLGQTVRYHSVFDSYGAVGELNDSRIVSDDHNRPSAVMCKTAH